MGFYRDKKCQKCGDEYYGTASSRYCLTCKTDKLLAKEKESLIKLKEYYAHLPTLPSTRRTNGTSA
jgi:hypothetical protein